jgi:hypothetical protein
MTESEDDGFYRSGSWRCGIQRPLSHLNGTRDVFLMDDGE